jgi:hypothetical protein
MYTDQRLIFLTAYARSLWVNKLVHNTTEYLLSKANSRHKHSKHEVQETLYPMFLNIAKIFFWILQEKSKKDCLSEVVSHR